MNNGKQVCQRGGGGGWGSDSYDPLLATSMNYKLVINAKNTYCQKQGYTAGTTLLYMHDKRAFRGFYRKVTVPYINELHLLQT